MIRILSFKARVTIIVVCVLIVTSAASTLGQHLAVGPLVTAVTVLLALLGNHTWPLLCRLPLRPRWAVDLNGKWAGEINSNWRPSADAPPLAPIPVTVTVKQTWLTVSVTLKTDKITSRSHGPHVEHDTESNELRIDYFYRTDPKAACRQDNPPQSGCGHIAIDLAKPDTMSLRYSNDRGGPGDITLTKQA